MDYTITTSSTRFWLLSCSGPLVHHQIALLNRHTDETIRRRRELELQHVTLPSWSTAVDNPYLEQPAWWILACHVRLFAFDLDRVEYVDPVPNEGTVQGIHLDQVDAGSRVLRRSHRRLDGKVVQCDKSEPEVPYVPDVSGHFGWGFPGGEAARAG